MLQRNIVPIPNLIATAISVGNIKGGFCRLEKNHQIWMMMIAARLRRAGAAEMPWQFKMTLEN